MGNRVYDYLVAFRKYCLEHLIDIKYHLYTGANSYILYHRKILLSFINNDVFSAGSKLHMSVYGIYDSADTLLCVMESLQDYIGCFEGELKDLVLNSNEKNVNFKAFEDAIQVLNILRLHFTWYNSKEFTGEAVSVLERSLTEFADEPFEGKIMLSSLVDARLNGKLGHKFDFNYIFCYKTSDETIFEQFVKVFNSYLGRSYGSYNGLLLFTRVALERFTKFVKSERYTRQEFSHDDKGYQYIVFDTPQVETFDSIKYSSFKIVFCKVEEGLYKLAGCSVANASFDKKEYRDKSTIYRQYCIDEKIKGQLYGSGIKISVPVHIDVFV